MCWSSAWCSGILIASNFLPVQVLYWHNNLTSRWEALWYHREKPGEIRVLGKESLTMPSATRKKIETHTYSTTQIHSNLAQLNGHIIKYVPIICCAFYFMALGMNYS